MNWTRPEIISTLALVISALGFVVSILPFWRNVRVRKSSSVARSSTDKNPELLACYSFMSAIVQRFISEFYSISVPLDGLPVSEKQAFLLVDYHKAIVTTGSGDRELPAHLAAGDRHLTMTFDEEKHAIRPDELYEFRVLTSQGCTECCIESKNASWPPSDEGSTAHKIVLSVCANSGRWCNASPKMKPDGHAPIWQRAMCCTARKVPRKMIGRAREATPGEALRSLSVQEKHVPRELPRISRATLPLSGHRDGGYGRLRNWWTGLQSEGAKMEGLKEFFNLEHWWKFVALGRRGHHYCWPRSIYSRRVRWFWVAPFWSRCVG